MISEILKNYNIILASASPRRQELFKNLNIDFEIRLKPIKEEFPKTLKRHEISNYLAKLKSLSFNKELRLNDILITSDTIVWHNQTALGKPSSEQQAFKMLKSMSNMTHEVITSVYFKTVWSEKLVYDITQVTFKELADEEIWYYIKNFNPLDKAGAYGIQDWIGQIGVIDLKGSFFNVMGLPVHLVYKTLNEIIKINKHNRKK